MANKRIIRVIIYEGPEELIDLYEAKSLRGSIKGGIPKYWTSGMQEADRSRIFDLKSVKITAETLEPETDASDIHFIDFTSLLEKHEKAIVN